MRGTGASVELKHVNWAALRQLLPYLFEFRARIFLALACLVLAKIASVALPFLLKRIVDGLNDQVALTAATPSALVIVPVALVVAYGVVRFSNVLFGELRDTLFGRVTERAMRRIGLRAFQHLHSLDIEFHLNRRTGGLSRDIERGTNGISFLLRFMVFNIVPTFIEIGMVIVLLGWNYSIWFAVIVFIAVFLYVAFSFMATEWRTRFVREANEAESRSSSRAVDSLLNFETVKYFTNESWEAAHYDNELSAWELARRKNRLTLFALNGGQSFIIAAAMSSAMLLAAQQVLVGAMTIGDFVLINAFMMQVFMPLNFLGFVYREMKGAMANIEALFKLLDLKPKIADADDAPVLAVRAGVVEFDRVSFRYDPDREILKDISFTVASGQKLAIVGGSGAGKSTLFKLLFRFYEPDTGTIRIDGADISGVSQDSLRGAIGVVPQDTVLFNTSILENIRYGRVDASDAEVAEALQMAQLSHFIAALPKGLHTLVGERGLKLSGGEKQRVAIARCILKQPPIVVFDEATSSLDSKSEQGILSAMRNLAANHTTLVIAHRLSTIVDADQILVLDNGSIVERGGHAELLRADGVYARMWTAQQRQTEVAEQSA